MFVALAFGGSCPISFLRQYVEIGTYAKDVKIYYDKELLNVMNETKRDNN